MTGPGPSGDPESSPSTPSGVCWSFSTHIPGSTPGWGLERAGPPVLPSAQRRGVTGLPGVRRGDSGPKTLSQIWKLRCSAGLGPRQQGTVPERVARGPRVCLSCPHTPAPCRWQKQVRGAGGREVPSVRAAVAL